MEFLIKTGIKILYFAIMRNHIGTRNALIDKFSGDFGLKSADVVLSEKKLAIQVCNVDCVHVNHVNIFDPHQSKVFQELTTKSASSNYQKLNRFTNRVQHLCKIKTMTSLKDMYSKKLPNY